MCEFNSTIHLHWSIMDSKLIHVNKMKVMLHPLKCDNCLEKQSSFDHPTHVLFCIYVVTGVSNLS